MLQKVMSSEFSIGSSRYESLRPLGSGGMGQVVLAQDHLLQREVAIKCVRPDLGDLLQEMDLHREAMRLARVRHRNIVEIYDVIRCNGQLAFVMEYVSQGNLRERILDSSVNVCHRLRWLSQISAALAYAHSQGVFHQDIKLENVLIDGHDDVKIADLGIATIEGSVKEDLSALSELALELLKDQHCVSLIASHAIQALSYEKPDKRMSAKDASHAFHRAWLESTSVVTEIPEVNRSDAGVHMHNVSSLIATGHRVLKLVIGFAAVSLLALRVGSWFCEPSTEDYSMDKLAAINGAPWASKVVIVPIILPSSSGALLTDPTVDELLYQFSLWARDKRYLAGAASISQGMSESVVDDMPGSTSLYHKWNGAGLRSAYQDGPEEQSQYQVEDGSLRIFLGELAQVRLRLLETIGKRDVTTIDDNADLQAAQSNISNVFSADKSFFDPKLQRH